VLSCFEVFCIRAQGIQFVHEKVRKKSTATSAFRVNSVVQLFSSLIRCSENDINRVPSCIAYLVPRLTSKVAQ